MISASSYYGEITDNRCIIDILSLMFHDVLYGTKIQLRLYRRSIILGNGFYSYFCGDGAKIFNGLYCFCFIKNFLENCVCFNQTHLQ